VKETESLLRLAGTLLTEAQALLDQAQARLEHADATNDIDIEGVDALAVPPPAHRGSAR
jgi:hypothetical protein